MDVVLRYAKGRGQADDNLWQLDTDGKLLAAIRVASGPVVHVALSLRHPLKRRRRMGEYTCTCLSADGDTWRVEHGIYDDQLPPPHPLLPDCSLLLTGAPAPVALELARLTAL